MRRSPLFHFITRNLVAFLSFCDLLTGRLDPLDFSTLCVEIVALRFNPSLKPLNLVLKFNNVGGSVFLRSVLDLVVATRPTAHRLLVPHIFECDGKSSLIVHDVVHKASAVFDLLEELASEIIIIMNFLSALF
jgi:hypothetical protein